MFRNKNCVGGVWGSYQKGLSTGIKEVLLDCQTAPERGAGLSPVYAELAGPTADEERRFSRAVEESLVSPAIMS